MFKRAPLASALGYDVHVVTRKDRVTPMKENPLWEIEMVHLNRTLDGKESRTDFILLIPSEKHRWHKDYWMGLIVHKIQPAEGTTSEVSFRPRLVTGARTKGKALSNIDKLVSDERLEMLIALDEHRAKFGVIEIEAQTDLGNLLRKFFEDGGRI